MSKEDAMHKCDDQNKKSSSGPTANHIKKNANRSEVNKKRSNKNKKSTPKRKKKTYTKFINNTQNRRKIEWWFNNNA